ncbi:hypothetical protein GGR53DRAFT_516489 [Hypoxylon sp. FL1150]|nr:hypothetical protein GGR53DRAFT_516489 [Hypoxylon sp. FL1150]
MEANGTVIGRLNFMKRLELYKSTKPYSIAIEIENWSGNVPRSNFEKDSKEIVVANLRGQEGQFTFEKNGFAVLGFNSSMAYEDFANTANLENIYAQELGTCLLQYFQATSVRIFSILIRRRHPEFPNIETRRTTQAVQPASRVHIDATPQALRELMSELETREGADRHEPRRFIYLNVWKPLRGPLYDWPLAFCDATTVNQQDLEQHDHIFPSKPNAPSSPGNIVRENQTVYHNPSQRWYYLSGQMPSELLLFRQVDSENNNGMYQRSYCLFSPSRGLPSLHTQAFLIRHSSYPKIRRRAQLRREKASKRAQ